MKHEYSVVFLGEQYSSTAQQYSGSGPRRSLCCVVTRSQAKRVCAVRGAGEPGESESDIHRSLVGQGAGSLRYLQLGYGFPACDWLVTMPCYTTTHPEILPSVSPTCNVVKGVRSGEEVEQPNHVISTFVCLHPIGRHK